MIAASICFAATGQPEEDFNGIRRPRRRHMGRLSGVAREHAIPGAERLNMSPRQIADLIDAHAPALLLYARQLCGSAEDVVQEAFLKLAALRESPTEVVSWLYRVVRNGALDASKSQRRRRQREQAVARSVRWFVEPEVDGLDAELAASAMKELPVDEREIIVAHLWGGLTFEQIAALAGTSASTAFRRYQAGIAKLRKRLGITCTNHQK